MCKYCNANNNDFVTINNSKEYSGIEMAINRQGMLRVRYYEGDGWGFKTQDILNIKNCPMCGRKFGG